ncbi:MAG: redoxin domain-containing protein, partial [Bdellovibrionaceae bacterium]|nr:redoxin domain-containing protein [Pseudobdellovibrionaceae bacterium]
EVLKKLAGQFKDFNFVAIHSNADETAELTKEYFVRAKLPFEIIQDKDSTLANKFKALKTPHVFVIVLNGEVQFQGGVTDSANASTAKKNYLQDALTDVQAGKPVAVATGRTLGCMIQRSGEGNSW